MIFDSHMHVGSFESMFGVSLDRDGIDELMRENEIIERRRVPSRQRVRTRGGRVDTGPVRRSPGGTRGCPGISRRSTELLDHPKFLGLKLHPLIDGYLPNDPSVHPLIELIVERDQPVLIHCGHPIFTLPWSIEELAVSFPAAKIIIGHMGHGNVVYINGSIEVALRNPNVYLETSGMPMHTKIREAYERVGETRVLFGTDVPFHHPVVEIAKVRVSGLPPEAVDRVLEQERPPALLRRRERDRAGGRVTLPPFDLHRARSPDEAHELLTRYRRGRGSRSAAAPSCCSC